MDYNDENMMDDELDEFENFLTIEKNLSHNTIAAYMRDLRQFKQFNGNIEEFFDHLKHEGISNTSAQRKLSTLRQFFKFINKPIIFKLPQITSNINIVHYKEILRVIDNAKNIKDKTFLYVLLATGCRVSEALNIQIKDINPCLKNQQKHFSLIGKGGKERVIFLTDKTITLIKTYIGSKTNKSYYLFESKTGKPLTRQWAHKMVKKICDQLNIDRLHPHAFRHAQAMILLESGADLVAIQQILGHAHLSSTERYLQLHWRHLQEAIDKHPLNK